MDRRSAKEPAMHNLRHFLPAVGAILGIAFALLAPGCNGIGYSIRPPYNHDIKSVYVPVFKSVTFRRDLNFMLTDLVIKEIERRTPYKVIQNESEADSMLEGTVNFTEKNVVVENIYNLPRQLTATMIVYATWTNQHRDKKDPPPVPAAISETFNFYPEIGETSEAAFYRCCEKLAVQIVNMMEEPW
jgi:hypothetical protein